MRAGVPASGSRWRRCRILLGLAMACCGSAVAQSDELPEWLDLTPELRAEVTRQSARDSTVFDADGELVPIDRQNSLLKFDAAFTADLRGSWSLKGRLAASYEEGLEDDAQLGVRELFVRGPIGPVELSVGRRILRWSNGYAFTPAGLLDPIRAATDPSDRLGRTEGRDLVQLDLYRGSHTWTAVYAEEDLFSDPERGLESVLALRYNVQVRDLDLSLIYGRHPRGHDKAAISLSYVLGRHLELHAEASGTAEGTDALLPSPILEGNEHRLYTDDYLARVKQADRSRFLEYLLGVNYTFANGLNVIFEYFHSDEGLASAEWDRYLEHVRFSQNLIGAPGLDTPVFGEYTLPEVNVLQAAQAIASQASRRDTLFLRLAPRRIRNLFDVEILALLTPADDSAVAIAELTYVGHPRLSPYLRGWVSLGDEESQYGGVPQDSSVSVGLWVRF